MSGGSSQTGKRLILRDKMDKRRIMKKSTTVFAKFETRIFELYQHLIVYSKPSTRSSNKSRGEICVMVIKVCECVVDSTFNRPFVFQVGYIDKAKMYYLYIQADSEEMRTRWIDNIRKLCATYNDHRMFSQYHPGHYKKSGKAWTCCGEGSEENIGCTPTFQYDTIRPVKGTMIQRHRTPNMQHTCRVQPTTANLDVSDSERSDSTSPGPSPASQNFLKAAPRPQRHTIASLGAIFEGDGYSREQWDDEKLYTLCRVAEGHRGRPNSETRQMDYAVVKAVKDEVSPPGSRGKGSLTKLSSQSFKYRSNPLPRERSEDERISHSVGTVGWWPCDTPPNIRGLSIASSTFANAGSDRTLSSGTRSMRLDSVLSRASSRLDSAGSSTVTSSDQSIPRTHSDCPSHVSDSELIYTISTGLPELDQENTMTSVASGPYHNIPWSLPDYVD